MCKDCGCGAPEKIENESSVEPTMNANVVTMSSIKGE